MVDEGGGWREDGSKLVDKGDEKTAQSWLKRGTRRRFKVVDEGNEKTVQSWFTRGGGEAGKRRGGGGRRRFRIG